VATKKASPKKKAVAKKPAAKKAAPKKKLPAAKPKVSNVDRLVAAGVIHADHVGDHNMLVINKLRSAEVAALVNLRRRIGPAAEGKDHLRPNFPV
jgi:hypothetical protein